MKEGHIEQRHAVLHDFCMCIPYGMLVASGGVVAAALGTGTAALAVAAAGLVEILLSVMSLKAWRQGSSSTVYTILSGVVASGVAWTAHNAFQSGVTKVATYLLFLLSASAALFFFYNVIAGGNPPPSKRGPAEKEE